MFSKLRKTIATVATGLILVAVPVAVPAIASADTIDISHNLGCGANLSTDQSSCSTSTGTNRIQTIVTQVVNIFSVIVGIVSVIMIIYGGFKYITSGGDSGNISAAKNTIVYALIGLVVVALAQFIVQFVLNKVASTS
jgi:cytochrome bd-type quinol oxidase subunit 2